MTFRNLVAALSLFAFSFSAFANSRYLVAKKNSVRYYQAVDEGGQPITVFKTRKGHLAQLIKVDGNLVLGIPGILDIGQIGEDGVHLGPEVLGTGVGIGIGPSGVGIAGQILGYGVGAGITPFRAYVGPREEILCPPLYNADGQGYRDCR